MINVFVLITVLLLALPTMTHASTSAVYNFDGTDLTTFFNNPDNPTNVTEEPDGGISDGGSIEVTSASTNAVFPTKDGYVNGGEGAVYEFRSYVKSVYNSGYSGMGFTTDPNAAHNNYAAPAQGVGISVHGGGFVYNNDSSIVSGDWDSANVTASSISDLLNSGSPDDWYEVNLRIEKLAGADFQLRVSVYSVNAAGARLRPSGPDAVDQQTFTNTTMSNASTIYSYFAFGGSRVSNFDNFSINLQGSTLVSPGEASVTGSAVLDSTVLDQANLSAEVLSDGGTGVTERGFVYSTTAMPTVSDTRVVDSGTGTGPFSLNAPNLPSGTYYFRPYATNSNGPTYGQQSVVVVTMGTSAPGGGSTPATPLDDTQVTSAVTSSVDTSVGFTQTTFRHLNTRFNWLRRNPGIARRSYQGIRFSFENPVLEQLFNGSSANLDALATASADQLLLRAGSQTDALVADLKAVPVELALSEARDALALSSLNPTGGPIAGDWSVWTAGRITVGESKVDDVESESESYALGFGIDRPVSETAFYGYSLNIGKDDTAVGNQGGYVKSKNLSLSAYTGFDTRSGMPVELTAGLGRANLQMKRFDSGQMLTGSRTSNMLFGSVKVRQSDLVVNRTTYSPFVRLEGAWVGFDAYDEKGGSQALSYERMNSHQVLASLGIDFSQKRSFNSGILSPFARLEYTMDLSSTSDAKMRYLGNATVYTMAMDRSADEHWAGELGLDYVHRSSGMTSSISYERNQSVGVGHTDSLRLQVSVPF